ncbi:unnamed protein product [Blepharisma stoltei]|uniref:Uncharacterized protein n=1 Tax=Blepharisma stoltei TaxID=1481888 RepID=A0AAU9JYH0_9CILI|nr:unnamed protein product [Blepharisma stoltei]
MKIARQTMKKPTTFTSSQLDSSCIFINVKPYIDEQNHILKESFREKLGEYMKRAEELAEYLHGEEISGNQPEEDD